MTKTIKNSRLKRLVHYHLHKNPYVYNFIYGLIILNVIAIMFESDITVKEHHRMFFKSFETFSIIIFTIEYLLRIWTAELHSGKRWSMLAFIFSPLGLVDFFSIIHFYLPMFVEVDLRVLQGLRLARLALIFKLGRFSKSIRTIGHVLKDTKADLILTIYIAALFLIVSSTVMYYVERDAQPDKFSSVGQSLWWAVATLTTVGYGDIHPITNLGKFLSGIIALSGIGFVALPTGIISSAFIRKIQRTYRRTEECTCPNCGTTFEVHHEEDDLYAKPHEHH